MIDKPIWLTLCSDNWAWTRATGRLHSALISSLLPLQLLPQLYLVSKMLHYFYFGLRQPRPTNLWLQQKTTVQDTQELNHTEVHAIEKFSFKVSSDWSWNPMAVYTDHCLKSFYKKHKTHQVSFCLTGGSTVKYLRW